MIQDGKLRGGCHGPRYCGADGLYRRRGSPLCPASERRCAGATAVSDCGRARGGLAGYDLSRPQELGLLACERPAQGLQAECRGHGRVQKNFAERVAEIRAQLAPGTPVEVWFQDEMRVGQKNKLTYRWARKGSRPRAAHDQRTQSTCLIEIVKPNLRLGSVRRRPHRLPALLGPS